MLVYYVYSLGHMYFSYHVYLDVILRCLMDMYQIYMEEVSQSLVSYATLIFSKDLFYFQLEVVSFHFIFIFLLLFFPL